jgi:TonB family protein
LGRFTKQYTCQLPGKPEPKTAYEFVERGMDHVRAEQFDCALGACSEAIRLDSRLATAYACRGGVLSNTGELLKALKDYDQALSLQPQNGDFFYGRAQIHDRLGNTEPALADLAKAVVLIESEFGRSVAFALRGRIYQKLGKLNESIKDYTEAIRLAPDFAYHHANRAEVYFDMKAFQKAIVDYSEAIRLDPKNQYFHQDRAKVYQAMGREDLAALDGQSVQQGSSADCKETVVDAGDVTSRAAYLPQPAYPPIGTRVHASGTVVIEVTIDQKGLVTSAHAISGHPLLQASSIAAARRTTFEPWIACGKPVKVKGTLRFLFAPPSDFAK